jgi:hypothetical protein
MERRSRLLAIGCTAKQAGRETWESITEALGKDNAPMSAQLQVSIRKLRPDEKQAVRSKWLFSVRIAEDDYYRNGLVLMFPGHMSKWDSLIHTVETLWIWATTK